MTRPGMVGNVILIARFSGGARQFSSAEEIPSKEEHLVSGDLDTACPKNERPENLCRNLCRNASKLTDSFDKGGDKVGDKDAMPPPKKFVMRPAEPGFLTQGFQSSDAIEPSHHGMLAAVVPQTKSG